MKLLLGLLMVALAHSAFAMRSLLLADLPKYCVQDKDCPPSKYCNSTSLGNTVAMCVSPSSIKCTRARQCVGLPMSTPAPICISGTCGHADAFGCADSGKVNDALCTIPETFCMDNMAIGKRGYCTRVLDAGAKCSRNTQCYGSTCKAGKCAQSYRITCGDGQPACPIGMRCYKNLVCVSKFSKGAKCAANKECLSGKCNTAKRCA